MMRRCAVTINQWKAWQRCLLLCVLWLVVFLFWYFFLEKPLLGRNQSLVLQKKQQEQIVRELNALIDKQSFFVYQSNLNATPLKQIVQATLTQSPSLTVVHYTEAPPVMLPTVVFPDLNRVMPLALSKPLWKSSATIVLFGEFDDFIRYLTIVNTRFYGLYFDSIDFNMNRYPKAEITIKVFTLKE